MAAVAAFEEPQSHTLHSRTLRQQRFGNRPSSVNQFQEPTTSSTSVFSDTLLNLCLPGRLSNV